MTVTVEETVRTGVRKRKPWGVAVGDDGASTNGGMHNNLLEPTAGMHLWRSPSRRRLRPAGAPGAAAQQGCWPAMVRLCLHAYRARLRGGISALFLRALHTLVEGRPPIASPGNPPEGGPLLSTVAAALYGWGDPQHESSACELLVISL